jgi:hypothetical protein
VRCAAHRRRGTHWEDWTDDQPIGAHSDRGQVLLDGRLGVDFAEILDASRHDDGLDVDQREAAIIAVGKEVGQSSVVGFAGIAVPNIGSEELKEPRGRFSTGTRMIEGTTKRRPANYGKFTYFLLRPSPPRGAS